jgi:hypothetical protein
VNPAAGNNTALLNANTYGHTEIVRMLLELPPERGVKRLSMENNYAL